MPLPVPRPGEILVKVVAAGLCHTDLVMPLKDMGGPTPITGSHEPAGIVAALGADVERAGTFKVGDRIMSVNTARACSEFRHLSYRST